MTLSYRFVKYLAFLPLFAVCAFAAEAPAPPTFYKNVLPILQKNCQACHRPGEIGPMPLVTYEGTRPWAKSIKANVLAGKMPPWFADPHIGQFMNDRRLTPADVKTITAWVDAGAPAGDPKDKPAPPTWHQGWNVRPDVVLQIPKPMTVPATGTLQYTYVVIPTGFTKDTWVTAAEIQPQARAVVHHMSAIVRPPGEAWLREAKPGEPYIPEESSKEGTPDSNDPEAGKITGNDEFLVGYAPGMQEQRFDIDQSAKLIPAGSDIVLQIHYTTNGKTVEHDQPRIALELAKAPPPKRFMSAVAFNYHWTIPPNDPNYEGHARLTFGEPVELVFIQPHMHLRGKDMTVNAVYPDGRTTTLLSVPHYSFSWQVIYYLAKPLMLPAGTRIEITAHWDNSANNPYNPDPAKSIEWGNQSWDEMLSVPMGVVFKND
jgi:mono/diheme cytochrome c family protein